MSNPNALNLTPDVDQNQETDNHDNPNTPVIEVEVIRARNEDVGETALRAAAAARRAELFNTDYTKMTAAERAEFIAKIKKERRILNDYINEDRAQLGLEPLELPDDASVTQADTSGLDVLVGPTSDEGEATPEAAGEPTDTAEAVDPSAETAPLVPNITPEEAGEINTISIAAAEASYEKAKQGTGPKGIFKKVIYSVLAVSIAASGVLAMVNAFNASHHQDEPEQPTTEQDGNYSSYGDYLASKNLGEAQEAQHGIRDGYYETGMYASPNKSTAVDFAYAPEVAKSIGSNDAREIAIAVADAEVEVMAQQIAAMPDDVKAHYGFADFKGLGWKAVEQKLEEMNASSPDLFDSISQCHHNAMRDAEYSIDHVSGDVVNGYIQHNGTGRYAHGNMEGVQCTTQENNTGVAKFAWPKITSEDMMMKIQYDEQGNVIGGCTQIIFLAGSEKAILVMDGIPSIVELPPTTPTTPNTPITPTTTQAKNQQAADANSGATKGTVTPDGQNRGLTGEAGADASHPYNSDTNTYDYTSTEQAAAIGYNVTNDIRNIGQESSTITSSEEAAATEEMVANHTAPEMVTGTREGVDEANDFDAGATVGTGEVTGDALSADGSGNTIQENLDNATGNQEANPSGDYSQGF